MPRTGGVWHLQLGPVLSWIILLLGLAASLALFRLPKALPEEAPPAAFSATRAMPHVAVIAREAHPSGSPAQAGVQDYVFRQIAELGLEPIDQEAVASTGNGTVALRNILVRLPGSRSSGVILLLTHTDTTPFGPGAQDNATGVAVLLELLRAVVAGQPLENDLIVMFEDGEELGYLGGVAFLQHHPWGPEVRLAIGLDTAARSVTAVLCAAPQSGVLVQALAESYRYPIGSSLFTSIIRDIGNDDNEVTAFQHRGIPGLALEDTYAFREKHSDQDRIEHITPAAVQHMGEQVLALTRRLGREELRTSAVEDVTYFTVWGWGLLHYPVSWTLPLAFLSALLFALLLVGGLRLHDLSVRGMALSFLTSLGLLAVLAGLGQGVGLLGQALDPNKNPHVSDFHPAASLLCFGVAMLLAGAVYTVGFRRLRRSYSLPDASLGALMVWLVATLMSFPDMRFAFAWPLLVSALAWGWVFLARPPENSPSRWLVFGLAALPAMLIFVPVIGLSYLGSALSKLGILTFLLGLVLSTAPLHLVAGVSCVEGAGFAAAAKAPEEAVQQGDGADERRPA